MNHVKFFKDLSEFIEDFRKIVLSKDLFENGRDFLRKIGFSANDKNRLKLKFKTILIEQHEEYINYDKNQEESVVARFLNN